MAGSPDGALGWSATILATVALGAVLLPGCTSGGHAEDPALGILCEGDLPPARLAPWVHDDLPALEPLAFWLQTPEEVADQIARVFGIPVGAPDDQSTYVEWTDGNSTLKVARARAGPSTLPTVASFTWFLRGDWNPHNVSRILADLPVGNLSLTNLGPPHDTWILAQGTPGGPAFVGRMDEGNRLAVAVSRTYHIPDKPWLDLDTLRSRAAWQAECGRHGEAVEAKAWPDITFFEGRPSVTVVTVPYGEDFDCHPAGYEWYIDARNGHVLYGQPQCVID